MLRVAKVFGEEHTPGVLGWQVTGAGDGQVSNGELGVRVIKQSGLRLAGPGWVE